MGCRGHARSRRFSTPGLVNELSRHERGLWESGKLTHHDFCEFRPRAWRTGQKRVWLRENRELVGGTPLTPFMRAALSADFANPFANSGDRGLYINSDATPYLHRLPADEWIVLEVVNHGATDGVAIGQVALYDRTGPIGTSSVCGPAQRGMTRPA